MEAVIAAVALVIGCGVGFALAAGRRRPVSEPVPAPAPAVAAVPAPAAPAPAAPGVVAAPALPASREPELEAEVARLRDQVTDVEGLAHGFKVRIEELEAEVRRYKRQAGDHLELLTVDLAAAWSGYGLARQVHALPAVAPGGAQEALDRVAEPLRGWSAEFALGGAEMSFQLGLISALGGRWEEAAKCFEKAAFDGLVPQGWLALADATWQLGRLKKAAKTYLKCRDHKGMPVHVYVRLAAVAEADRRFDDALEVLDRVLGRDDLEVGVYLVANRVCRELGDSERAVAVSEAGLARHPDTVALLAAQIVPLARLGHTARAEEVAARAQELDPEGADAPYALGVVYLESGADDRAAGCFEDALVLRPDFAEALCGLGVVHNRRGEFKKALELFRPAIAVKPDYADAYFHMRAAYEGLRDFDNAIAALNKAVQLDPRLA